jgi:hypothetical protein
MKNVNKKRATVRFLLLTYCLFFHNFKKVMEKQTGETT